MIFFYKCFYALRWYQEPLLNYKLWLFFKFVLYFILIFVSNFFTNRFVLYVFLFFLFFIYVPFFPKLLQDSVIPRDFGRQSLEVKFTPNT